MNYMKEIAKLLGLELNEEFYISPYLERNKKDNDVVKYRITYFGFEYQSPLNNKWQDVGNSLLTDILAGNYRIKKAVLTVKEKKYLKEVIDPFKFKVTAITKYSFTDIDKECISICIKEDEKYWREMQSPMFPVDKYYKNMEVGKAYTLEELGL